MRGNALRLFGAVERGLPLPFGGLRNRRSLLYTGNLTAAILATLGSPAGSDLFFVSDDDDVSTPGLVAAIASALDRPARLVPIPVGLLRAAGRAGDMLARVCPFPLTTAALERLLGSLAVDCSHLRLATGYAPPYRLHEGLRLTADWYLTHGRAGA
jgi:nucleoside-diphosphate-sugar epimerase